MTDQTSVSDKLDGITEAEPRGKRLNDLDVIHHGPDRSGFNEILIKYRNRLKKVISMRINLQLQGRLDASDIIQDAYVEASRTLDAYLEDPKIPVYLWLRHLVGEKLIQAHRFHLCAKKRQADREVSIHAKMPSANSHSIAAQLVGGISTPSQAAIRNENKRLLMEALDKMDDIDREVLVLRHFEQLTGRETAIVLDMGHEAVKKRYIRALEKLERSMKYLDDTSKIET